MYRDSYKPLRQISLPQSLITVVSLIFIGDQTMKSNPKEYKCQHIGKPSEN